MAELSNPGAPRWDWDRGLREAGFPQAFKNSAITHADLDGCTDTNGHFLAVEGKRIGPNGFLEPLSQGQLINRTALVRDGWTVYVVWGFAWPENAAVITNITHMARVRRPEDDWRDPSAYAVPASWEDYYNAINAWREAALLTDTPKSRPSCLPFPEVFNPPLPTNAPPPVPGF